MVTGISGCSHLGLAGVRQRARARGIDVQFKMDLGPDAPEQWRDEIDQVAIPGGIFGELVFFHKASRTLILADTIINLELDKINQPWRFAARLTGMYYPRGQIFFGMRLPLLLQKKKSTAAVERVLSWEPDRVILSHGRCFSPMAARTSRVFTGSSKGVLTLSSEHCFLFLILLP